MEPTTTGSGSGAEPTAATQDQDTVVTTPEVPVSAEPQATAESDPFEAIASLDRDELLSLFERIESGELPTAKAEVAPTETPTESEPQQEPETTEEPEGQPKPESTEPKQIERISVRGLPEEQRVLMAKAARLVKDGEAKDIPEAIQKLTGTFQANPEGQGEVVEPDAPEQPEEPADISELQARLANLRKERKEAKLAYEHEKEVELTDQIEDTLVAIQKAEIARDRQAAEFKNYESRYLAAVEQMEEQYPEAQDESSAFHQVLNDKVIAARAKKDPRLQDPSHILKFAEETAKLLGLRKPAGQATTAPQKATPPAVPAKPARPVGEAVAPGTRSVGQLGKAEFEAAIASLTPEQLLAGIDRIS